MDDLELHAPASEGTDGPAAEPRPARFEPVCAACLAVLVALLAVTGLGAGKYADERLVAAGESASAYSWYGAKSVNQTVLEGQYDLLSALRKSGGLSAAQSPAIDAVLGGIGKDIARFRREKSEILLGSRRVGREGWALESGGKLGRITGAVEWDDKITSLGRAGSTFDFALLLLLLCLIPGAFGLAFEAPRLRLAFFSAMVVLGAAGTVVSAFAFVQAANL